jgi:hypothetical protein
MMNWKGCGRKLLWLNFRYYLGIRLEEVRESKKSQGTGLREELTRDLQNTNWEY